MLRFYSPFRNTSSLQVKHLNFDLCGLVQTQSYRLPENVSHQPSIKYASSKLFSLPQPPSCQRRQPTSHAVCPTLGPHFKTPFKIEDKVVSIQGWESSPFGLQAHISSSSLPSPELA